MSKRKITSTFNIFDTGRKYTGQERGYILDNAKRVIGSDIVQERLKLGELYGYFSHYLREASGKLGLGEKVSVILDSGKEILVDAIPANRTTEISIDDEGNVTHTQEIFDNTEGDKVWNMHENKMGGWSWAAAGAKRGLSTILSDFRGFDYVKTPLFSGNKGYVLDSAEELNRKEDELIIDGLKEIGLEGDYIGGVAEMWSRDSVIDINKAQKMVLDSETRALGFEIKANTSEKQAQEMIQAYEKLEADSKQVLDTAAADHEKEIQKLSSQLEQKDLILDQAQETRKAAFDEFSKGSTIQIPENVLSALVGAKTADDLEPLHQFICDAAKIPGDALPLGQKPQASFVKEPKQPEAKSKPDSIGALPSMSIYE